MSDSRAPVNVRSKDPLSDGVTSVLAPGEGVPTNCHAVAAVQAATAGKGSAVSALSSNAQAPVIVARGEGDLLDLRNADNVSKFKIGQDGTVTGSVLALTSSAPSASAVGDAAAVGDGTTAARGNHVHGREALTSVGTPAPSLLYVGAQSAPIAVQLTDFRAGHGYSNNAGGSVNLNDTAQYVLGVQSVSATTDGAATAKTIKKTGFAAVDATGRIPVVWVKIDDPTNLAGFKLYLGDTNLANSYQWEMKASTSVPWLATGAWHKITLPWGLATTSGSPTRSAITDAQLRVIDNAAGTVTVHLNGIALVPESTVWTTGVASITFDDGFASQYTDGRPYMDRYGFAGTAYVIQDYIGAAGRLTLAQLHALEDYNGWEVAGHASTGDIHSARFTSLSASAMESEANTIRAWLRANGFRGDHLAFPGGEYNATVLSVADRYFSASRTVFQRSETLPPAHRSKLRSAGYVTSATLASAVTTAIDAAYANKEWIIITFHNLLAATLVSTDYALADYQTIIDYLATKGIPVRTVGDVLRTRP